jgi:hypothetical protein
VREQDEISLGLVGFDGGLIVVVEERVDKQAMAVGFNGEAGVAEPGDLYGHGVRLGWMPNGVGSLLQLERSY